MWMETMKKKHLKFLNGMQFGERIDVNQNMAKANGIKTQKQQQQQKRQHSLVKCALFNKTMQPKQ